MRLPSKNAGLLGRLGFRMQQTFSLPWANALSQGRCPGLVCQSPLGLKRSAANLGMLLEFTLQRVSAAQSTLMHELQQWISRYFKHPFLHLRVRGKEGFFAEFSPNHQAWPMSPTGLRILTQGNALGTASVTVAG